MPVGAIALTCPVSAIAIADAIAGTNFHTPGHAKPLLPRGWGLWIL